MSMVQYMLVVEQSLQEFNKYITGLLCSGWKLHGAHVISYGANGNPQYSQSLIRINNVSGSAATN